MLIKKSETIKSSEITGESQYLKRRDFIKGAAAMGLVGAAMPKQLLAEEVDKTKSLQYKKATAADESKGFYTGETLTPYKDVTSYNNFYEFGMGKSDPSRFAPDDLITDPWSVKMTGHIKNPGTYHMEDILKRFDLEERIYRLRCVEAWSMVIPWIGFTLKDMIQWLEPTSKAKYVAFETLYDPKQMPGQRSFTSIIHWPYREGLRMDEAMNDLTLMSVGLYGKTLPAQNGAPIRLVVPWKYGFKSIKSIVGIHFLESAPETSWERLAPNEYGFYANVNPNVSHPRWSQATERRLPSGLFDFSRRKTEIFNGYGDQVASLYKGMDLRKNF
ncbi:Protein-methionine-sulfoxide reductase catalytic subunit MsrP [BD1-7 clade bacterium]|uniref:Protein-methionine-sulfoxide reductase catalytic subunit MsrP n=1 Tax=BD1-7 clade bacterium TaxID=2029982 RepID=A0A5S9PVB4_9GAMM|nr:Protein-methionine-sulfoxide reductase catalytic subunit MsrP [BD1-7 clade bacterium]CAA0109394.1 Protein-methionine-sulfoxide reductase catalytic subunit MsrP [BD1-7 clade bacterium]